MTFRVTLRMELKPGCEQAFVEEWNRGTEAVTGHHANLGQWLCKDTGADDVYWIVSDWLDEPRFRAFESSPTHREHRARLHPYRSGGSFHTMEITAHIPGRAASADA
ncbi:antibiotic biosynthesis monooxygenase family protein [Streptomyces griseofuscus]|uniref:Antibiotic biosynthesis monooxygenase n=1 Tax=Streptomyces griseofuscus TaxID=146922 RepID=A0A426SD93_9ACTN|nr:MULTISPECIES: antibiotic biosynthesis monooxygenase family protein [Streptomyces]MBJ6999557.1 antibiotic biosynthesis monooxygenase [Streptomyces sp. CRPSP2-6A1]MYR89315.1 antibiotic biosynthesis monooxygenase [Streptomyces sp. SID685]RRQ88646.1 antibiotic biosynthesis monooxygenase [Streptomyces griseofuscus]